MPSSRPETPTRVVEPALWAFSLAVLVFVSGVRLLWADGRHSWLWPFGLWAAIILVGAVVNRRTN